MNEPPVIQSPAREKAQQNLWRHLVLAAVLILLLLTLVVVLAWRLARPHNLDAPVVAHQTFTNQTINQPAPPRQALTPQDFFGTWSGKWDNTWKVRFTISQGARRGKFALVYEWEEAEGQPMRQSRGSATLIDDILRTGLIEITLSVTNPTHARAVGNFKKRRTADLIRE